MVFIKHRADTTMVPFIRRLFPNDGSFGELLREVREELW